MIYSFSNFDIEEKNGQVHIILYVNLPKDLYNEEFASEFFEKKNIKVFIA